MFCVTCYMLLPQSFYNRPTLQVAQDLLGCFLIRKLPSPVIGEGLGVRYKIVETEAYNGPNDLASHASKGRTPRNEVMFGKPGTIYVYFTYGMHYMLNIVTEKENYPAAVLIRAIEPIAHNSQLATHNSQLATRNSIKTNGPAKLTKHLKINKSFNCLPIYTKKHGLWIENCDTEIKPSQIKKQPVSELIMLKNIKIKNGDFILKIINLFLKNKVGIATRFTTFDESAAIPAKRRRTMKKYANQ